MFEANIYENDENENLKIHKNFPFCSVESYLSQDKLINHFVVFLFWNISLKTCVFLCTNIKAEQMGGKKCHFWLDNNCKHTASVFFGALRVNPIFHCLFWSLSIYCLKAVSWEERKYIHRRESWGSAWTRTVLNLEDIEHLTPTGIFFFIPMSAFFNSWTFFATCVIY